MLTAQARRRLLVIVTALLIAVPGVAYAASRTAIPEPVGGAAMTLLAGESSPIPGFKLRSTAATSDTGATISQPGYSTSGWYTVGPRSTVFAGLLANGVYPDPFFSTNMKNVPTAQFNVPWWYRADFTLGSETGLRTYVDFSGVLSRADVFVNGTQVATSTQVVGAYTRHEFDLTAITHSGVNSIAIRVHPNDPNRDLTMGWIDWLQTPPDKNMGIVRDVVIRRSGQVVIRNAHVKTTLATPGLGSATLTAKADVRNDSNGTLSVTLAGSVAGNALSTTVSLAAHETKTITFPVVNVTNPQVWWPAGMGAQALHDLDLTATVGGVASDTAHSRFGIRDIKAPLDGSGHRRYSINGRALLIKGGGWSPDLFLRWDPRYVEDKLRYVLDMGLNTVRLEGHIENNEFFDLTDSLGILTLPGWECCDKWEGNNNGGEPGDAWSAEDYVTAKASMVAEGARLRDHPSVISFLIGSDFQPTATVEQNYVDALNSVDWPTPIIAAASAKSGPITGPSGMKMPGPYDWVPPSYWYNKREGGAFGFASETSAGPDVPTLDTLQRMMTTSELNTLWQDYNAVQYHRSQSSTFNTLKIFDNAITGRYGAPTGLTDYVKKAQLAQYENVRAQFESFGRNFSDSTNPANGVIYWMLNSGWTSLHWQLFDYYLDQNGAYYGAKKAGEPLHIQYSYDTRSVVVVNSRHAAASGLTASVKLYNLDGSQKFTQTVSSVTAPGDGGKTTVLTIPSTVTGLNSTYLAKLVLSDANGEVSRNVYWLSTASDVIDWANNDWYYVPTTSYANLKGLGSMGQAPVTATATTTEVAGVSTTAVTLQNTSTGTIPAFYLDAHIVNSAGKPVLPVQWNDNAVSLWPGESLTLTASYRTSDLNGSAPFVRIAGWNTATQTIPGNAINDPEPPTVPGNLRTTSVGATSVGLAWDPSTDNVGVIAYDVFRGGSLIGSVPGNTTSYTDTTVAPAATYTYTVKARDAAGLSSGPSNALPVTTSTSTIIRYEAENATISQGLVESNHLNYSGTGFVNYDNVTGSYVQWSVNAPAAGNAKITLRYANGTTTNRPMSIIVNGSVVAASQNFGSTTNWDTWANVTLTVPVVAGANTIRATSTTVNGGPNADYLEVDTSGPPPPPSHYEAEGATISQGLVEANHLNYSGTGFVNLDNIVGSYLQWNVTAAAAGPATLTIRFANGTTANRPMSITVNGTVVVANQAFNPTTNWDTWANVTIPVTLVAGANTIRVTSTTATGGPNLDYLDVS